MLEAGFLTPTPTRQTANPRPPQRVNFDHDANSVVRTYEGLVRAIARTVRGRLPAGVTGFDEADLVSAGMTGLLDACERYTAREGASFENFATFRIRGAIYDEIRRHDFFPRRLRASANRLRRARKQLESKLDRPASTSELATHLELSTEQLKELEASTAPYRLVGDEREFRTLRSDHTDALQALLQKERRATVRAAIQSLPEKQRIVTELYFLEERKLSEIGDVLGVTVGRVSQLKSAALANLRASLADAVNDH